jgi:hypothetical protein
MSITVERIHSQLLTVTVEGDLSAADVAAWRRDLQTFVSAQGAGGGCGLIIEAGAAQSITFEALDGLLELLGDPEGVLGAVRMRIGVIGVKGFTQRFLREALPLTPLDSVRARFFHEVARSEARAWVDSLPDAPPSKPDPPPASDDDDEQNGGLFGRLPFGRRKS